MHKLPNKYFCGMCDAFAIGLHRVLGLPLGLVSAVAPSGDTVKHSDFHAVCVLDAKNEVFVDAAGVRKGIDAWRNDIGRFIFVPRDTTDVVLRTVSEEEVRFAFTTSGVSEKEIEDAIAAIKADFDLASVRELMAA